MAISKGEAMRKAKKNPEVLDRIEKEIDKGLVDSCLRGRSTTYTISTSLLKCRTEEIIARYKAKGWKVKLVEDFRDGDYLEFK